MFQGFRDKINGTRKKGFFLKNGAAVLERIISLHNGVCNPIRSYSFQQLKNATNNFGFQWQIHEDWNYKMYKGNDEDREILVKKFVDKSHLLQAAANEVAMASRMSNHKNVLKLLSCCLETEVPLLFYEFTTIGNLRDHIYRPEDNQLPRKQKLRIVTGVANAVAYLHHGLSKTIIHRDIKPTNIFLDENHTAKLFEFQEAIPIPEGKTHVEGQLCGTMGFVSPEVFSQSTYTVKSDVHAFGVLLLEVLTGKRWRDLQSWSGEISNNISSNFNSLVVESSDLCSQGGENREPVSPSVQPNDLSGEMSQENSDIYPQEEDRERPDSSEPRNPISDVYGRALDVYGRALEHYCESHPQEENRAQVLEYVKLVRSCIKKNPEERPNMIEVEKALRLIETI